MKNLSEALKKSMLNKLEKHDKYYIVWPRVLIHKYKPYMIKCNKSDTLYPKLYILSEKLMNEFKDENKNIDFYVYTVNQSYGNIQKFKEEYEKGNIMMDWNTKWIANLDLIYDNTEK